MLEFGHEFAGLKAPGLCFSADEGKPRPSETIAQTPRFAS